MLTAKKLSIGHVERAIRGNISTEIYQEHGVYHVRQFKDNLMQFWESFNSFYQAQQFFNEKKNQIDLSPRLRLENDKVQSW
jgi:hypothetical protein